MNMHRGLRWALRVAAGLVLLFGLVWPALADEAVDLYYVVQGQAERLSLPSGARTSYSFSEGGAASYALRILNSDTLPKQYAALTVSDEGVVTPKTSMYMYDNTQDVEVTATLNGASRTVRFHVIDYGMQSAERIMAGYLSGEIRSSMTVLEKVDKIAEIAARDFDYSVYYSDWKSMLAYGGGDCWANTDFIVEACSRLGIKAVQRRASGDEYAGQNHVNALFDYQGQLYVADAGKSGVHPRQYSVVEKGDFSYRLAKSGSSSEMFAYIVQYDRDLLSDTSSRVIVLPDSCEGCPVRRIWDNFNRYAKQTEQYVLPDTVNYIGKAAFAYNESLKHINLPEGLTWIADRAFTGCKSLGRVDLPETLTGLSAGVFSYCGTLTLKVPEGVTSIADDAFNGTDVTLLVKHGSFAERYARQKGLRFVVEGDILSLPADLTAIGPGAFEGDAFQGVIVPDGAVSIGGRAFAGCARLEWIDIPASVTHIEADAFAGCSDLTVFAPAGSTAASFAANKGFALVETE